MNTTAGPVMEILRSVVTGSRSTEEVLEQLDSCGVDWYITHEGTLMIRYWQVGAEGFVSPEQVGTLKRGNTPADGPALEWVSQNLEALRQQYAGRWIAVSKNQIVAHAPSLPELLTLIPTDVERRFVTQIPGTPVVWHTTYAG